MAMRSPSRSPSLSHSANPFESPFDSPDDSLIDVASSNAASNVISSIRAASTPRSKKRRSYPSPGFTNETEGATAPRPLTKSFQCDNDSLKGDDRIHFLIAEFMCILDDPVVKSPLRFKVPDWEMSPLAISAFHGYNREQDEWLMRSNRFPLFPIWRKTKDEESFFIIRHFRKITPSEDDKSGKTVDFEFNVSTRILEYPVDSYLWERFGPLVWAYRVTAVMMTEQDYIIDLKGFFRTVSGQPKWEELFEDIRMRLVQLGSVVPRERGRKGFWNELKRKLGNT